MADKLEDVFALTVLLIIVLLLFYIVIWFLCKIAQFLSDIFSSPPVYTPSHLETYTPSYTPAARIRTVNFRSRKILALDAEMIGAGDRGQISMLARVSIVNKYGQCIYDEYVAPILPVTDYRTFISGIREKDLIGAPSFYSVRRQVQDLIDDCILVGHDLKFDLNVLKLPHPPRDIRDTALYEPFREITKGNTPSLKRLAKDLLGIDIQHGEHSSVKDARAAMKLYCTVAKDWERALSEKRGYSKKD